MRVDKYLKVARVLKRRSVSKELAVHDRIMINGKVAKPSSLIKVNDEVSILFGNRLLKIKVLGVQAFTKKDEATDLYEIIEEGRLDTFQEK